jgi:hypothetical protein
LIPLSPTPHRRLRAALYDKSITLSWQTTRSRKDGMTGEVQNRAGIRSLRISVSSNGRIFSENIDVGMGGMRRGWRRPNVQMSRVVSDEGEKRGGREWRTEGRSLVAYI